MEIFGFGLLELCLYFLLLFGSVGWMYRLSFYLDGIPTNFPFPFFGTNLIRLYSYHGKFFKMHLEDFSYYKSKIIRGWLPSLKFWDTSAIVLTICDPDIIRRILVTEFDNFDRSILEQEKLEEMLGGGLILVSNGNEWKEYRDLANVAFHKTSLKNIQSIIVDKTQILIQQIKQGIEESKTSNSTFVLPIQSELQKLLFDIISLIIMGVDFQSQKLNISPYNKAWRFINKHMVFRFFSPIPYWKIYADKDAKEFDNSLELLNKSIYGAIKKRRENLKEERSDLLSHYITEEGQSLSDKQIKNQIFTLLFAGHDTVTNLCTSALYFLSQNPDVYEKASNEVHNILSSSQTFPSYEDLQKMIYLKAVLKETLRMRPGAPMRGRTLTKDITLENGIKLKKGTTINLQILCAQNHPDLWDSPEKFDPSRFLNEPKYHPYAYIPFGGGKRKCIGENLAIQEGLTVISMILYNFNFILDPNFKEKIEYISYLTMETKPELPLIFSLKE